MSIISISDILALENSVVEVLNVANVCAQWRKKWKEWFFWRNRAPMVQVWVQAQKKKRLVITLEQKFVLIEQHEPGHRNTKTAQLVGMLSLYGTIL